MIQHIILGLIQGVTEFLPVSSSGHLVIAKSLFGIESPGAALEITLHLATALAVVVILWKDFRRLLDWRYAPLVLIGILPAGIVGVLFSDKIESMFGNPLPVGFLFLLTGGALLATRWVKPANKPLNWWRALVIGLAQVVAILPGVSRSGATVAAALFLGLAPEEAFRFSFFMLLPVVLGGALLDAGKITHLAQPWAVVAGFVAALLAGIASLYLLRKVVVWGKLFWFSFYLFAAGIASVILFIFIGRGQ